jgi:hypothetical protein
MPAKLSPRDERYLKPNEVRGMYLTPAEYRAMYLVEAERAVIDAAVKWFNDGPFEKAPPDPSSTKLGEAVARLQAARAVDD